MKSAHLKSNACEKLKMIRGLTFATICFISNLSYEIGNWRPFIEYRSKIGFQRLSWTETNMVLREYLLSYALTPWRTVSRQYGFCPKPTYQLVFVFKKGTYIFIKRGAISFYQYFCVIISKIFIQIKTMYMFYGYYVFDIYLNLMLKIDLFKTFFSWANSTDCLPNVVKVGYSKRRPPTERINNVSCRTSTTSVWNDRAWNIYISKTCPADLLDYLTNNLGILNLILKQLSHQIVRLLRIVEMQRLLMIYTGDMQAQQRQR